MLGDVLKKVWSGRLRLCNLDTRRADNRELQILLDSVRRGLPMGVITVWNTIEDYDTEEWRNTNLYRPRPDDGAWYAIDGAARLAGLAELLTPPPERGTPHPGAKRACIDLKHDTITLTRSREEDPRLLPLNCLFDSASYLQEAAGLTPADSDKADIVNAAFRDYQIPIAELTNCSRDAVDLIRERRTLRA